MRPRKIQSFFSFSSVARAAVARAAVVIVGRRYELGLGLGLGHEEAVRRTRRRHVEGSSMDGALGALRLLRRRAAKFAHSTPERLFDTPSSGRRCIRGVLGPLPWIFRKSKVQGRGPHLRGGGCFNVTPIYAAQLYGTSMDTRRGSKCLVRQH